MYEEVPDFVQRGRCPGNIFVKNKEWGALLQWLDDHKTDYHLVTMTTLDTDVPPRSNMLASLASFCKVDAYNESHRRASAALILAFYNAGLINMKMGASRDTALLRGVSIANYSVCSQLLEFGAGIPLLVILWTPPGT